MGTERFPGARLRLLRDTTTDSGLREQLGLVLGDVSVPVGPSHALEREIDACLACCADAAGEQLCPTHATRWRRELRAAEYAWRPLAGDRAAVVREALGMGEEGAQLIAALRAQTAALRRVSEACARGAARLPEGVVRAVHEAERLTPAFLHGADRGRALRARAHAQDA